MIPLHDRIVSLYQRFTKTSKVSKKETQLLRADEAIALTEAALCDSMVISATGKLQQDRFWAQLANSTTPASPRILETESARSSLAALSGLTLAGHRSAIFLTGQELATASDLLLDLSQRHLPCVIQLASGGMNPLTPEGQEAYHLASASGCFMLFASNLQEAVDYTVISHMLAEKVLMPGIVAVDTHATWLSRQEVKLIAPDQMIQLVGHPQDQIHVANTAQRLLFGRERRRVPRWFDPDRPVLLGAHQSNHTAQLNSAGQFIFFSDELRTAMLETLEEFSLVTGRQLSLIKSTADSPCEMLFVTQGSSYDIAAAAIPLLKQQGHSIGVVGIQSLRPFPADNFLTAISGSKHLIVLERSTQMTDSMGPLTRELKSALTQQHARPPLCHSVFCGRDIQLSDLLQIPKTLSTETDTPLFLGAALNRNEAAHPKREVLVETLTRAYSDHTEQFIATDQPDCTLIDTQVLCFSGAYSRDLAGLIENTISRLPDWYVRADSGAENIQGADVNMMVTISKTFPVIPGHSIAINQLIISNQNSPVPESIARMLTADAAIIFINMEITTAATLLTTSFINKLGSQQIFFIADTATAPEAIAGISTATVNQKSLSVPEFLNDLAAKASTKGKTHSSTINTTAPELLAYARTDDEFDSLPRHWDQQGVFFHENNSQELTVDPYLTANLIPPLAAVFRPNNISTAVPEFDASKCTGCGQCWSQCPDAAISVTAIRPSQLIDHSLRHSGAESLRQIAGQLGSRISANAKSGNLETNAGNLIRSEAAWLLEKMAPPEPRKQELEAASEKLADFLGDLPVAVTETLFLTPEQHQKDSGELLILNINPDTCKRCQLCVQQCEPGALVSDGAAIENSGLRQNWARGMSLPDTSANTIVNLLENNQVSSMGAIMLSRHCAQTMTGGDIAEPGSGEKLAIHQLLAVAEFCGQPVVNAYSHDIEKLKDKLIEQVQDKLTSSLPGHNLDSLIDVISDQDHSISASELTSRLEKTEGAANIPAEQLRQFLKLANQLAGHHEQLTKGIHGLGRARYSLVLGQGSLQNWAAAYPYNPFSVPVTADRLGTGGQLAAGLLQGQLLDTTQLLRDRRRAELLLLQPGDLSQQLLALDQLSWQDFTKDELKLCPPVILIGHDEFLAGSGLSEILWLLSTGLPVKIVALTELDLGIAATADHHACLHHDPRIQLAVLALSSQNAFVTQTSIAHADHFFANVSAALAHPGPALIRIYTPSPSRHQFTTDETLRIASLAVDCHAHPLFSYDPTKPGVHGQRMDLFESSSPETDISEWLEKQGRFSDQLANSDNKADQQLTEKTTEIEAMWQTLKELSGKESPFTKDIWEAARAASKAEQSQEIADLLATHSNELNVVRSKVELEIADRIRQQLVRLVNHQAGQ